MGELATERVLKIAKAAEAAKRLGQEAARAAGELELGAGDGVGTISHNRASDTAVTCVDIFPPSVRSFAAEAKRKNEAAVVAAAEKVPRSAATVSAASNGSGYEGDADVVYSDGAQASGEGDDHPADSRRSKSCNIQ